MTNSMTFSWAYYTWQQACSLVSHRNYQSYVHATLT